MGLQEYRRKRDFRKTPEPRGRASRGRRLGTLRFVVQKHAASRLHYDFRLEMGGVLRSWAVPKGPSLDPAAKRLAVRVEDHPLDYIDFEGVIPAGEYGGGSVMVWDAGTWKPEEDPIAALDRGVLKFELRGERLRGRWLLARMGGERNEKNWLLIKERDAFAHPAGDGDVVGENRHSIVSGRDMDAITKARDRVWRSDRPANGADGGLAPAPLRGRSSAPGRRDASAPVVDAAAIPGARKAAMPARPAAQLATLVAAAPSGGEWLHEIKFDGYRMMARIANGKVRIVSRNGKDWTRRFPTVAKALERLPVRSAVVDGEIVHLLPDGVSSFSELKTDLSENRTEGVTYYAFDLLHLDGYALTGAPLVDRKEALAALLGAMGGETVRYSEHIDGSGEALHAKACGLRLEGIVSKRRDAPYRPGRAGSWVKVKCLGREEFVIIGWTDPAGGRKGLGALLLGYHDADGNLQYAGRVGTGFTHKTLRELRERLHSLRRESTPLKKAPADAPRGAHWVRPDLVAEIRFTEWTPDRRLRHPSYLGLREDKAAAEVIVDPAGSAVQKPRSGVPIVPKSGTVEVAGVRLTHADKVLYPEHRLTKLDLARYYLRVADRMLPHLRARPLTLLRCPDGRGGQCFYQKHDERAPEGLRRIAIPEKNGTATYLVADDVEGLVSLVQMGVLEIHLWGSTGRDLERPDRIVIDLDPDEGLPWERVAQAAVMIRDMLGGTGLRSFPMATGGKGLHVVAPLLPRNDWEEVKSFSRAIADALVLHDPAGFTASLAKRYRKGKIFVDHLRNQRGATAIAPYSVRARPGAPAAAPLTWDEVEGGVRSDQFTAVTLPDRMAALPDDPWKEMAGLKQKLPTGWQGRWVSAKRRA